MSTIQSCICFASSSSCRIAGHPPVRARFTISNIFKPPPRISFAAAGKGGTFGMSVVLTVSRRLGHEHIRITLDLYGHLLPGQDEAAAAAMDRLTALWQQRDS